jgi:hypothetical protein
MLQLAAIAPILFLSACAAEPTARPTPTPTPTPTLRAVPRPPVVRSFGPNGTHFPAEMPWIGETAANEFEVECTWVGIGRALNALTPEQVAAGAVIRVRPGVLTGRGAGSRRPPTLAGLGNPEWTRDVAVVPRDGYGSVQIMQEGIRIENCHRFGLFGFDGSDIECYITNSTHLTLGWSEFATVNITQSGSFLALYEIVLGFRSSNHDTFAVRPTENFEMLEIERHGCVFGPSVKPLGDEAHSDTIQLERTGLGLFGPFRSTDCIDFGSSNAVILAHDSLSMVEFEHCLILGENLPWRVFPLTAADDAGVPNAFAGLAPDVRIRDSYVCGPIGRLGFTHVTNSALSYRPASSQQPTVEGAWTVDEGMANWTSEDMERIAGTTFEREVLASNWTW